MAPPLECSRRCPPGARTPRMAARSTFSSVPPALSPDDHGREPSAELEHPLGDHAPAHFDPRARDPVQGPHGVGYEPVVESPSDDAMGNQEGRRLLAPDVSQPETSPVPLYEQIDVCEAVVLHEHPGAVLGAITGRLAHPRARTDDPANTQGSHSRGENPVSRSSEHDRRLSIPTIPLPRTRRRTSGTRVWGGGSVYRPDPPPARLFGVPTEWTPAPGRWFKAGSPAVAGPASLPEDRTGISCLPASWATACARRMASRGSRVRDEGSAAPALRTSPETLGVPKRRGGMQNEE